MAKMTKTVMLLTALLRSTAWAVARSQTKQRTRGRAKAKITVQSSEAKPYDQTESPALMEIRTPW